MGFWNFDRAVNTLLSVPKLALVFILSQILTAATTSASPEDWVSGSPFSQFTSDDSRADTFTSAYLNVSIETEDGSWKWDKTEVGRFGGGFVGPSAGVIIHVSSKTQPDDHTGCQLPFYSTRPDRKLPPPGEPWIALIKRGRCNFEVKVENAFRSNAAGVLVYNDRDSATLDKMKLSSDSGRNISAVFTYKWKGEDLAKLAENNSKAFVHITIAGHTSSRTANINRTSVLFVSITFIVLMIISLAWLVFYYVQRFRYIHAKDRLSKRLGNAAKKALSKIPTKNIKSEDKEVQGDCECCAICIEPYKVCDFLRILPCGHEFHKSCIDPWLLDHRTCPMCKMDILKHYGFVFSGSQESILQMEVEEIVVLDSNDSHSSPRRGGGGISPLPEIRGIIIPHHQRLFESSAEDESSRASTPDEMTPSLSPAQNRQQYPVRQDLCISCIAAKAAAALTSNQSNNNIDKDIIASTSDEDQDDSTQVLSMNNSVKHSAVEK